MNNQFGTDQSTTSSSIKDSVKSVLEQGTEAADAVKNRVGDLNESLQAYYDRTADFIKANPLKSVGMAFAIGYVAMRIKTSPVMKIALIGGLAFLGTKLAGAARTDMSGRSKTPAY